jgi:hypothetical protein
VIGCLVGFFLAFAFALLCFFFQNWATTNEGHDRTTTKAWELRTLDGLGIAGVAIITAQY